MLNKQKFFLALLGIGASTAFYVITEERAKEMKKRKGPAYLIPF